MIWRDASLSEGCMPNRFFFSLVTKQYLKKLEGEKNGRGKKKLELFSNNFFILSYKYLLPFKINRITICKYKISVIRCKNVHKGK